MNLFDFGRYLLRLKDFSWKLLRVPHAALTKSGEPHNEAVEGWRKEVPRSEKRVSKWERSAILEEWQNTKKKRKSWSSGSAAAARQFTARIRFQVNRLHGRLPFLLHLTAVALSIPRYGGVGRISSPAGGCQSSLWTWIWTESRLNCDLVEYSLS